MKRVFIISLVLMGLMGCGVRQGDVYHNLADDTRIEVIATGNCKELTKRKEEAYEVASDMMDKKYYTEKVQLLSVIPIPVPLWDKDSEGTQNCYSYYEKQYMDEYDMSMTFEYIRPTKDLTQDRKWKKLN